jgi:hypothetical protein
MTSSDSPTRVVVHLESADDADDAPTEHDVTEGIDVSLDAPPEPARRARRRVLRAQFARVGLGVWVGLLLTAGGFGLIAFTWGKTAALLDVATQIPYLVSGGLVGLGLILVGLLVINLSVKRREALGRQRQLEELREALVRLRASIEGDEDDER